jgi:2'-5' RNA ligase
MPDAAREFDAAWERFQSRDRLILGPETLESAWAHGRDRYAALLIPVDDPPTVAHISRTLERTAGIAGIDPYPEPYWHITIKGIGFMRDPAAGGDEISSEHLEHVSGLIGDILSGRAPFEVQVGRANAFPEVVFLEAWEGGHVRELNTRITDSVPGIVRQPHDGPAFLPHISIARFSSDEALAELKGVLRELREDPPGPAFVVRHLDLICAHLSAGPPELERLRRYELGG